MGDVTTRTATARTRLSKEERRSQLLDLGVRLLSTRSLDELSIDLLAEEAGISRGLLYHYFGNKHDFHEAVVRRAADDLIAQTAPPVEGKANAQLQAFLAKAFGVAKSQVSLESGELNRQKRLRIHAPKSLPPLPGLQRA